VNFLLPLFLQTSWWLSLLIRFAFIAWWFFQELFEQVGVLKKCQIFYDRDGQSTGQAEITFASSAAAQASIDKYNGQLLDGDFSLFSFIRFLFLTLRFSCQLRS